MMQGKEFNASHLTAWVTDKFITTAPAAAALALQTLATHEAVLLLKPLKAEQVVVCMREMDNVKAAAILRRFPSRQTAYILSRLPLPQAAAIYQAFSEPQQAKMKALLESNLLQAFSHATEWPAESAGAYMKREFISFKTETKVAEILEKLKNWPRKKFPSACFIVNKDGQLKGYIRTAELAFLAPTAVAGSVMSESHSLSPEKPAKEAKPLLQQGQVLVPVIDGSQVILGTLSWAELLENKPKKRFGWF